MDNINIIKFHNLEKIILTFYILKTLFWRESIEVNFIESKNLYKLILPPV